MVLRENPPTKLSILSEGRLDFQVLHRRLWLTQTSVGEKDLPSHSGNSNKDKAQWLEVLRKIKQRRPVMCHRIVNLISKIYRV